MSEPSHYKEIKIFNWQSQVWILLSIGVIATIISIIYNWKSLQGTEMLRNLGIVGISGAVVWWYWTMYTIQRLLKQRLAEHQSLVDLVDQIKFIKDEIKKSFINNTDNK
jgi:hypothetical protein